MKIYLFLIVLCAFMPNFSLAEPSAEDLQRAALRQEVSIQFYHIIEFAWTPPNRFFFDLRDKVFSRFDFIVGLVEKDPRFMTALKDLGSTPSQNQPHAMPLQFSREIQSPNFDLDSITFLRAYRKFFNATSFSSSWYSMDGLSKLRGSNDEVRKITNQLAAIYLEDHGDNSVSSDLYDKILKLAVTNPERLPEILKLYSSINSRVAAAKVMDNWLEQSDDAISPQARLARCTILMGGKF